MPPKEMNYDERDTMNEKIAVALRALDNADLRRFARAMAADAEKREAEETLSALIAEADSLLSGSVRDGAWLSRAKRFLTNTEKKSVGNAEADKRKKAVQKAVSDAELRLAADRKKTAEAACRDFRSKFDALRKADLTKDDYMSLHDAAHQAFLLIDTSDPLYAVVASLCREFKTNYMGEGLEAFMTAGRYAGKIKNVMDGTHPEKVFALWDEVNKLPGSTIDRIPNYRQLSDLYKKLQNEKAAHEREVKEKIAGYKKRLDKLQKEKPSAPWMDAVLQLKKEIAPEDSEVRSALKTSWLDTTAAEADEYRRAFRYDADLAAMCGMNMSYSDVKKAEALLAEIARLPYAVVSKMQNTAYNKTLQSTVKKLTDAENERLRREEKRKLDASIDDCYAKATKGDPDAMTQLALYYYEGRGVTRDYGEAFLWFEKAAKKGNAKAMEKLGDCYMNGQGVKADYRMAEKCYKKAEKLGR